VHRNMYVLRERDVTEKFTIFIELELDFHNQISELTT